MTCAKAVVRAYLLGNDGIVYYGENIAHQPQEFCPRAPGEGYEKCHSVCRTAGHAEEMAIREAGAAAFGGFMLVDYHYICESCMSKINDEKITAMTVEEFLAQGGEVEILGDTVEFKTIPLKRYRLESAPPMRDYRVPATFNNRVLFGKGKRP